MKQPYKYTISDFTGRSIDVRRKLVDRDFRMHWHECCELELILSGSGVQTLNGVDYPLRSGEFYLLTSADCHSIHVREPLDIIGVMFEEKLLSQSLYEAVLTRESLGVNLTANLTSDGFATVRGLLDALVSEFNDANGGGSFENEFFGHILDCLAIKLLDCSNRQSAGGTEKSPVSAAILYLHSHYSEKVTLGTLAELTHLSRNYFSELFRIHTGRPFKSYLIDLRMRNACRYLANTDMSVTDICFACGFETFSNFMRTFRQKYGTSPLRFRTDNRETAERL